VTLLLVGEDQTTYYLARQFASQGHEVTVITRDPEQAVGLSRRLRATIVPGDGTDPVVLERAGARRATAVLALSRHDHENLAVCQAAQRRFGVPRTVAVVHDPDHEEVFRRLGVTVAVSATRVLAQVLEGVAGLRSVRSLVHAAAGSVAVSEVEVREGYPAAGRALREFEFPEGALVGCIVRGQEAIVPRGETQIRQGDVLMIMARQELHARVVTLLTGENE
jgi:trk system potassium uptake protein TrkA